MSTASHTAAAIMDRSAALMNDAAKTDYSYGVMIPYLNMAIEELNGLLEEANVPITNQVSTIYEVPSGANTILNPPFDLVEIQEVGERPKGNVSNFLPLPRREFPDIYPATNSLLFWCWMNQKLMFNPNGANAPMEVQLKYIGLGMSLVRDPEAIIGSIHSISYLSYKTAALCSMFIGEDSDRASILEEQSEKALERIIGISNKGKQQMMTRHRPFRASFKMRGY